MYSTGWLIDFDWTAEVNQKGTNLLFAVSIDWLIWLSKKMQKPHLDFDGESATFPRSNPAKKLSPTNSGLVFFRPLGILFLEIGGKNFYTEEQNAIDHSTSSLTFFRSSQ